MDLLFQLFVLFWKELYGQLEPLLKDKSSTKCAGDYEIFASEIQYFKVFFLFVFLFYGLFVLYMDRTVEIRQESIGWREGSRIGKGRRDGN